MKNELENISVISSRLCYEDRIKVQEALIRIEEIRESLEHDARLYKGGCEEHQEENTGLRLKIAELEASLEAWKQSWSHACGESSELRTKLESKNKTLGLVVQALAETIGEQER